MPAEPVANATLFIDVELDGQRRITEVGALLGDHTLRVRAPLRAQEVAELDRLAARARWVGGHNLLEHDLPLLQERYPGLALLQLPAVDTLVLSPLVWPDRPFHRLVKPYKTVLAVENDPVADCRGSREVLQAALSKLEQGRTPSWPFLRVALADLDRHQPWRGGLSEVLGEAGVVALARVPALVEAIDPLHGAVCSDALGSVVTRHLTGHVSALPLAFALRWIEAAGPEASHGAVLPPWVRHRWPATATLLDELRGTPCDLPSCAWCRSVHDPEPLLRRHFGYPGFRAKPTTETGGSLQRAVVLAGLRGQPHFAAMPTGGGKSIGFQLPALARYTARGTLTVVVSPLQSLMQDQVLGLREKTGTQHAAALHGMLTSLERTEVLEGVRTGAIGLLYLSPEQLRNRSVQRSLEVRELGGWVFDEAHCLSTWGHDFRTDYRYVLRFVRELAARQQVPPPPVSATTATAQVAVVDEICSLIQQHTGQELTRFVSTTERDNLTIEVRDVPPQKRLAAVVNALNMALGPAPGGKGTGSAIVFVGTQKKSEEWAMLLEGAGWSTGAFHAGLDPAEKRDRQAAFMAGSVRVMCATSAFGMGIDKEDVRLVVHVSLPGSLESYLQQAGRAGRDRAPATCLLLYDPEDTEAQFRLAADHELRPRDISALLRVVRKLSADGARSPTVVSHGELMRLARARPFSPENRQARTQVNTAVSWLERAHLLKRDENRTRVFQGRLKHRSLAAALSHLRTLSLKPREARRWQVILEALADSQATTAHDADDLADLAGVVERRVPSATGQRKPRFAGLALMRTLHQMVQAGLLTKGVELSAWVTLRVVGSSAVRLEKLREFEAAIHTHLQQHSTDLSAGATAHISLRELNEALLTDHGLDISETALIVSVFRAMAGDGKGLAGGTGSLHVKTVGRSRVVLRLHRSWSTAVAIAQKRHAVAARILRFLTDRIDRLEANAKGRLLVEFAVDELVSNLQEDIVLRSQLRRGREVEAVERALLSMHELDVLRLDRGLAIFRPAMTLRFDPRPERWQYTTEHHALLAEHYRSRTLQIHVVDTWARRAVQDPQGAATLAKDWFQLDRPDFLARWMPERKLADLERRTTSDSHDRIVTSLDNPDQQAIVTWKGSRALLVLAGPGSGKTRVIVHRCAWLVREERVPPGSVLVLCYNRATALEVRQRLRALIGADARRIDVFTYHGLALRLVGRTARGGTLDFASLLQDAADVLRSDSPLPAVDQRSERILAGYEHILVDEYQDIDEAQYQLVSLVAGRSEQARTSGPRLRLTAVGDDDQNIYDFRQTSTEYIRRFESDYNARTRHLLQNYRSTQHILDASQALIRHDPHRLKSDHTLVVDLKRKMDPHVDVIGQPVRILLAPTQSAQLHALVSELRALYRAGSAWSDMAVLARGHRMLSRVRQLLEEARVPHVPPPYREGAPPPGQLRRIAALQATLQASPQAAILPATMLDQVRAWPDGLARRILEPELVDLLETSEGSGQPATVVLHRVWEAVAEARAGAPIGDGVRLSTLHGVKGLEFQHVCILDGDWPIRSASERAAERRLLYVGMTRARETLTILSTTGAPSPLLSELDHPALVRQRVSTTERPLPAPVRFELLGLQVLDLDWAGRHASRHSVHVALRMLEPGHAVRLMARDGGVHVVDPAGRSVARLSRQGAATWLGRLPRVLQATVYAVILREATSSREGYRDRLKVDAWAVPVVEVRWR